MDSEYPTPRPNNPATNGHLSLTSKAEHPESTRLYRANSISQLAESTETKQGFSFTVPASGFNAEDISVSLDGSKLKVDGKHVTSSSSGRKIYNEFMKVFDLPAEVEASDVHASFRDGHTLHISVNSENHKEAGSPTASGQEL